jgi:hypothetical protein
MDTTIAEAQADIKALRLAVWKLASDFEEKSGLHVHSIPVHHDAPGNKIGVTIKVQIPNVK